MSNPKILVVDDEEQNLKLISMWLIPLGYDVDFASNGEDAVKKCLDTKPDLVILDIMMPVMDGYEACKRIKADLDMASTPIIMVTALHDQESRLKGLNAGANEFLSKPIDNSELTLRVWKETRSPRRSGPSAAIPGHAMR